jgi:DNA helicase-2/ATP-dependent DNA helicase PcrA
MPSHRPADLLAHILDQSGLRSYYAGKHEFRRLGHLEELIDLFRSLENNHESHVTVRKKEGDQKSPCTLRDLLEFTALARNVDHLSEQDQRLPVITIHQAKGLEFEAVYIAGLTDNELPNYYAIKENRLEEERRLFYVALTRARSSARISWHRQNQRGYNSDPSRFLQSLPHACVQHV